MKVRVFDPVGMDNAKAVLDSRVFYAKDNYEVLEGVDGLAIVTEWNLFKSPDFVRMKELMKRPVVFDGRNILNVADLKSKGFIHFGIGRGNS